MTPKQQAMGIKGKVAVKSFTNPKVSYLVDLDKETCNCPAFQKNPSIPCKHIVFAMTGKKPKSRAGTKGGYPLDEVISAVQKSIRRGQERKALYWAYELVGSGFWRYFFSHCKQIKSFNLKVIRTTLIIGSLFDQTI